MRCASALSTTINSTAAFREVLDRVSEGLGGEPADLAVAFVSEHHAEGLGALVAEVRARRLGRHIVGCTGESIVGEAREVEGSAAVSLLAVRMPGIRLTTLRLSADDPGRDRIAAALEGTDLARPILITLGDPFSFPTDGWLKALNEALPGLRVVGGMASGGNEPGQNRLVLDDTIYKDGAVAVLVDGTLTVRTVVSQGCRPIGRPLIVTKVDRNLIRELGRRPAIEVLRETFQELDEEEQALVRNGLHIGRVINEYQDRFDRGDFLVRNVLGADESGGLAITDLIRVGQTVQFHVRDATTAEEDLRSLLTQARAAGDRASGALLFTCNGRGTRLFAGPDHDVAMIREVIGKVPIAGFFAMGELGPIGGQNFLHGFTASLALFGP